MQAGNQIYKKLYLIVILQTMISGVDSAGASTDPLTGIWKSNHKQPFFFQVQSVEQGTYRIKYGYRQCGVWGIINAKRQGPNLYGDYRSGVDAGEITIEFSGPQDRGLLHWKDADTGQTGDYPLFKITASLQENVLDVNASQQAERYQLIESAARAAVAKQMGIPQWSELCEEIRRKLVDSRNWPKGWPLPTQFREIGWNDWEIGWVEIDFLQAVRSCIERDRERPFSELVHHRFHLSDKPRAGYDTRHESSYRKINRSILKQFMKQTRGRTGAQGIRHVRSYYAMWDFLTANESHGIIARTIPRNAEQGELPQLGLYNDSHQPKSGQYTVQIHDGERLISTGTGQVTIPPYEEIVVDLKHHAPYAYFYSHVSLQFSPEGYHKQPIPKDRIEPFHETLEEYVALSRQDHPRVDFAEAVLWAGVKRAWDANDLKAYQRAVRDAGGRLFLYCGKQSEVLTFVRQHLSVIEPQQQQFPEPGLATGDTELVFDYDPLRGQMIDYKRLQFERYDPEAFARLDLNQQDLRSLKGRVVRFEEQNEPQTVKLKARVKDGRLHLDIGRHELLFTGTITLYDGPVKLGTYSLDGSLSSTKKEGVLFTDPCRLVTFYQDAPGYQVDLKLHCFHERVQSNHKAAFNLMNQLNQAGAFVRPIAID